VRLELGNEPLLVDAGDAGDGEDANVRARAEQLAQPVAGPVPRRRQGVGLRDAPDLPVGDRDPLDLSARRSSRNFDIGSSTVRGARSQDCSSDSTTIATSR